MARLLGFQRRDGCGDGMVTVRFEAVVQDATISSLRYCYTSYHSSYIYVSCERGHDHIALGS